MKVLWRYRFELTVPMHGLVKSIIIEMRIEIEKELSSASWLNEATEGSRKVIDLI